MYWCIVFISSASPCSIFIIFEKNRVSYEIVPFETLGVSFAIYMFHLIAHSPSFLVTFKDFSAGLSWI